MTNEHSSHLEYRKPGDFGDMETLLYQMDVLQPLDLTVDVDRLGVFVPAEKVEIGAITERLGSGTDEGLKISADLGSFDDGLRKLREQESNEKLRRLLTQAQQKMANKDFRSATGLIDRPSADHGAGRVEEPVAALVADGTRPHLVHHVGPRRLGVEVADDQRRAVTAPEARPRPDRERQVRRGQRPADPRSETSRR